jgi:hypothetical protein
MMEFKFMLVMHSCRDMRSKYIQISTVSNFDLYQLCRHGISQAICSERAVADNVSP